MRLEIFYYLYPGKLHVTECGCQQPGSRVNECDNSGQCICNYNFAGQTCDRCAPGYYKYPECSRKSICSFICITYLFSQLRSPSEFVSPAHDMGRGILPAAYLAIRQCFQVLFPDEILETVGWIVFIFHTHIP